MIRHDSAPIYDPDELLAALPPTPAENAHQRRTPDGESTGEADAPWWPGMDAATFLGRPIEGNESIEIHVTVGSAIVYGATTDNVTNDPAVQFPVVRFSTGS